MGAAEMIQLGLAGINLLAKSIEAANAGNLVEAQAHLDAAREHFSKSVGDWDAAGKVV